MPVIITEGRQLQRTKTLLYGPEGVGKSTFAAQYPNPIFIDTEGSTTHMANVKRFDGITQWQEIFEAIDYVRAHKNDYQTLVIDTADWAELMCSKKVCATFRVSGIEDIGYGKGYTYLSEEFKKLLDALDLVIRDGLNVVITAHAKMRKFEQPDEMGAYDRWELKLSKQVAPLLKEWADMVLFANFKTNVVTDDKTKSKKGVGSKRVMYTQHHACWDAKNRFGLPECVPFEYSVIADIVDCKASALGPIGKVDTVDTKTERQQAPKTEDITPEGYVPFTAYNSLKQLMDQAKITDEEVQCACATKGLQDGKLAVKDYPEDFIEKMLIAKFAGFSSYINKEIKSNPYIKHYEEVAK